MEFYALYGNALEEDLEASPGTKCSGAGSNVCLKICTCELHGLPVRFQIQFKVLVITFKALHDIGVIFEGLPLLSYTASLSNQVWQGGTSCGSCGWESGVEWNLGEKPLPWPSSHIIAPQGKDGPKSIGLSKGS